MAGLANFTKQYQVQKTLKFELIPQGKTQENINAKGFINEDAIRNENYQKVKVIIDDLHKRFMEHTLSKVTCDWSVLATAIEKYRKDKNEANKKSLIKVQEDIRKEIIGWFTGKNGTKAFREQQKDYFDKLFKEKLFSDILRRYYLEFSEETQNAIDSFDRFTTYFTGFHENRKNMYSAEAKSTSVAYRLVNDNFPKFLSNCEAYSVLAEVCPNVLLEVEQELRTHDAFKIISLDEVFKVAEYDDFLSQSRIDYYNQIIGGIAGNEGTRKIRGINEVVNNAIQQNAELKTALKGKQFSMVQLFKQILSDRSTLSFISNQFCSDQEVIVEVKAFNKAIQDNNILSTIKVLFGKFDTFDFEKVFVSSKELTSVSNALLNDWNKIRSVLSESKIAELGSNPTKTKLSAIEKEIKNKDFSIAELSKYNEAMVNKNGEVCPIVNVATLVLDTVLSLEDALAMELPLELQDFESKTKVKRILDGYENLYHILSWFKVSSDNDIDSAFYGVFDIVYDEIGKVLPLYNKVRNYATKKPYSVEKFKLNFAMPNLASGWDKNKERDNGSILLLKDGQYYLGIMNPQDKPNIVGDECTGNCFKKMVYKMFPDISKMVTKCTTQLNAVKAHFSVNEDDYVLMDASKFTDELVITKEIFDLNNVTYDDKKKFQIDYLRNTGDFVGYHKALATWINFVKDFLSKYKSTSIYNLDSLLPTMHYERLDSFYNDVNNLCYKIDYENVSVEYINKLVDEGKLYLFKIHNKDFAVGATGKPNLHTLYWKAVFEEENMLDVVVKLNGGAELFYRPKSNMPKIEHKVGEKIVNRKNTNGTPIEDWIYRELYAYANGKVAKVELSEVAQKELPLTVIKDVKHNIIKDRRFLQDKYFFHVPITLNYKADSKPVGFNDKVQKFLKNNPDINIIGIDRGERNLLYVVVIDQQGNIIDKKQVSFNEINGYDYHAKLNQREKERIEAKQAWDVVGKIKELKEGYLSLVVREIADMMVKYNAIVVMENLNVGFKRVRSGIAEKAVYQKFEKMLIDKLNYLVFKDSNAKEPGGVLNAYQLTDKFESFEKMGSQSGFLFYVPAAYTSKIDPVTGFASVFSIKGNTNIESKKEFICNFDSLVYDEVKDKFVLECNLEKFKTVVKSYIKKWKLVIGGKRIVYNPKDRNYVEKYPCEDMKAVLDEYGIDFNKGDILKSLELLPADKLHHKFFDGIYWTIINTLQLRNSNALTGEDYIISPVANCDGKIFDSRTCSSELPKDADANGAYHIALKGLFLLNRINSLNEDVEKVDLSIKNEDWFKFVQTKPYVR